MYVLCCFREIKAWKMKYVTQLLDEAYIKVHILINKNITLLFILRVFIYKLIRVIVMVFNANFKNISVLLVEETGLSG
jgi:hypothetical protein